MTTGQAARSGVIVVRVWRQSGATVARVLTTVDVDHPVEESVYCSSADEVCATVRLFFDRFDDS